MGIINFELVIPTEINRYCVFAPHLEDNKYIFFHMTPADNMESIVTNGFCSAKELGVGDLESVSYAKRSSGCFANLGCQLQSEFVIFAVKFEPDALNEAVDNPSDIHVYKKHLQPEILGIVRIPAGFKFS